LGHVSYGPTEAEKKSLQYRRSLYIVQDMQQGDVLTLDNVRAIRPGFGLSAKYLDVMIGKALKCNVQRGTALRWDMI